jgi:hypothetical protein
MSTAIRTEIQVEHHGRPYSLWRRGDNFYLRFERDGRTIWKSLRTADKATAKVKAKSELDQLAKNDWKPQVKVVQASAATFGQIFDRFTQYPIKIADETKRDYIWSLSKILHLCTGKEEVRELKASLLTEELLDRYIDLSRKSGRADHSIKSTLTQARAIFSKRIIHIYKALEIPDIHGGFFAARDLEGDKSRPQKVDIQLALDLDSLADELWERRDPMLVPFLLMSKLGMRNKQALDAKWSDLIIEPRKTAPGHMILRVRGNYREAVQQQIAIHPDILGKLMAYWRPDSEHIIYAETDNKRSNFIYRDFCNLLRPYMVGRRKIAYELRRWAGQIAYTADPLAAKSLLGHRHLQTTERSYADDLRVTQSHGNLDQNIYAQA